MIFTSTHRHIDTSTHRIMSYRVVKNLHNFSPVLLSLDFLVKEVGNAEQRH